MIFGRPCLAALALTGLAAPVAAGEADVLSATAARTGTTWTFTATVAHADTGREHYADAWRVVTPEGRVLGVRDLLHPHVDEQPFTRTLRGVAVPEGVSEVRVEARDSVHGWGGQSVRLRLDR